MKLSLSSMYALRSLAYLAEARKPALSREIARSLSISPTYLTKILQTMRVAGIVTATRGSKGGFGLNRSPSAIRLRTVIALFEDLDQWNYCPFSQMFCWGDRGKNCVMHPKWLKVSRAFSAFVDGSTVADLKFPHSMTKNQSG